MNPSTVYWSTTDETSWSAAAGAAGAVITCGVPFRALAAAGSIHRPQDSLVFTPPEKNRDATNHIVENPPEAFMPPGHRTVRASRMRTRDRHRSSPRSPPRPLCVGPAAPSRSPVSRAARVARDRLISDGVARSPARDRARATRARGPTQTVVALAARARVQPGPQPRSRRTRWTPRVLLDVARSLQINPAVQIQQYWE